MTAIKRNDLYTNKKEVGKAIQQRSELINELLKKIDELIGEHRKQETSLLKLEQIDHNDSLTGKFTVDLANSSAVAFENNTFSVRTGMHNGYYPIFANEPIPAGSSY